MGNSLAVQWLGLRPSVWGMGWGGRRREPGSIPHLGTKIPQAAQCGQKKKKTDNSDSNLKYSVIKGLLNKLCQSTIIEYYATISTSQITLVVKNPPANVGHRRAAVLISGWGRVPWRRAWQPTPVSVLA